MENVGRTHNTPTGPQGPEGRSNITQATTLVDVLPKRGNAPIDNRNGLPPKVNKEVEARALAGLFHDGT